MRCDPPNPKRRPRTPFRRPPLLFSAICALGFAWAPPNAPGQKLTLVQDINPGPPGSNPSALINFNGQLFFAATDGVHGSELWKCSAAPGSAVLLGDIRAGSPGSNPASLANGMAVFNGALFFNADDGLHGLEPWKTNGTTAGTVLVKDVFQGAYGSESRNFTPGHGILFFIARDLSHGQEVWKTDGSTAGTVLVKDLRPGPEPRTFSLTDLVFFNGRAFFAADDGTNKGRELYRTDGTALDTSLVSDIAPVNQSSSPLDFHLANGKLLFTANDIEHGRELWATDGSTAGTELLRDIRPDRNESFIQEGRVSNDILYFQAYDGSHGRELWRSDGSPHGTSMVKDIYAGSFNSSPANLVDLNGTLFFAAADGIHGVELWKSDGSPEGTVLVKDINPGAPSSNPQEMASAGGRLFFNADDGLHGREPWTSDGTAAGTVLVKDLNLGAAGSDPRNLTPIDNTLFFGANDGIVGREPWALRLDGPGPPALKSAQDIGHGRIRLEWFQWYEPPMQFLGAAWDLYANQWAPCPAGGGLLHPLGPQGTEGEMDLRLSGAYFLWVLGEYQGGVVWPTETPLSTILYSAPPHPPLNFAAEAQAQPNTVRLTWSPEIYGTWQYQIIAFRVGTGFVQTTGPLGTGYWHSVPYPSSAFLSGTLDLDVPSPGDYWFAIHAVGWLPPYPPSPPALAFVSVP